MIRNRLLSQQRAVWAVAVACVIAVMGLGLVDPILPGLAKDLHATPSQVELLFSSYTLSGRRDAHHKHDFQLAWRQEGPVSPLGSSPQASAQWARRGRVVRFVALSVLMTLSAATPQAAARSQPRICQLSCPGA
jgi:hypothetical protein